MWTDRKEHRLSPAWLARIGLATGLCLTVTPCALGAGPLGRDGEPITTSAYALDLFQGPVLANARTTGLAGANAAIAEGVDGNRANAAAPAVRRPWSLRWCDPHVSLGFTLPGTLSRTDFDNDGRAGLEYGDFHFLTAGANLALGRWGIGFSLDAQNFALTGSAAPGERSRHLEVTLQRGHLLGAHALLDGQLVVGAGAQLASLELSAATPDDDAIEHRLGTSSAGFEAGILWAPTGLPLRLAVSGRSPARSEPDVKNAIVTAETGDARLGSIYLPQRLAFPWEAEFGWALQLGKRRLNVPWENPRVRLAPLREQLARSREARRRASIDTRRVTAEEAARLRSARQALLAERRAAYAVLPREKLLITSSLLLSGPVETGVGYESFLRQTVLRSGRSATLTPRLGIEFEPLPHQLQLRGGTYLEPSRFELGSPRLHGTASLDVRLVRFDAFGLMHQDTRWRVGAHVDAARQYLAWGLSGGLWR